LLHDDVMDRDTERRHRPTAWALMGEGEAILAGDALLALAQERLIDPPTPERLRAAAALSEATADMITGQAQDLSFERRDDVGFDECVAMLANKTAALLACSCRLGAILGGGSAESVEALGAFGRWLGIAFQAVDDILGIWGRPEVTGKPVHSDLRQRKKSLPVVAALEAGGSPAEDIRRMLTSEGDLDEEALALTAKLVEENGGRSRAQEVAADALARALASLDASLPSGRSRDSLLEISNFITAREF
jgi:geranylgeranyl diphosphate synthase type I